VKHFESSPCQEAAVVAAAEVDAPCTRRQEPWIIAATILGSSMAFVDGTVVNTALSALQRDLGASMGDLQWVVESYAVILAAGVLVGGALGDRFGRRRVFALGVGLFGLASAACGLAPDVVTLTISRGLQGLAGALLLPGSLAILGASFSRERRGAAIGLWSSFSALSAGLGLVIGGWLIDVASWRMIFFINLPLAVATLLITFAFVPESRDDEATGRVDALGAGLVASGLGLVTFGFIEANHAPFADLRVAGPLGAGTALLVAFVAVEARVPQPMLPLRLFDNRVFTGANVLTLFLYAALAAVMFFLPLNLIQAQGYTATQAGAANLPLIATLALLGRQAGTLVDRFGPRRPLLAGTSLAAVGMGMLAFAGLGGSYWTGFFPGILVLGLGMSLSAAPISTTVMGAVEGRHAGLASGVNNATSRVAAVLSIAILGPITVAAFAASLEPRLAALDLAPGVTRAMLAARADLAALPIPDAVAGGLRETVDRLLKLAFVDAYRVAMLTCAASAGAAFVSALLLIREPAAKETHGEE
jgi:EmrB/QacA subfamily drug resistance transporter